MALFNPPIDLLPPSSLGLQTLYTSRSPSRSPRRREHRPVKDIEDDIYRDLSPAKTLRAIVASSSATSELPRDEQTLIESIKAASDSQKAFGRKVAESTKLLKEWCQELGSWPWPGAFEEIETGDIANGSKKSKPENGHLSDEPSVLSASDGHREHEEYSGSLSTSCIEAYEERLEHIADDLEALDIDEQKTHVLNAHIQAKPVAMNDGPDIISNSPEYVHIDGLTALTTVTILQGLPYYSRLMSLMHGWSSRIFVLKQVPQFFDELRAAQLTLNSSWSVIGIQQSEYSLHARGLPNRPREQGLFRQSFDHMKQDLAEKIAQLGTRVDSMLDALEGQEETLPETWIDAVEEMEKDYSCWTVEAERSVHFYEYRLDVKHGQDAHQPLDGVPLDKDDSQYSTEMLSSLPIPGSWTADEGGLDESITDPSDLSGMPNGLKVSGFSQKSYSEVSSASEDKGYDPHVGNFTTRASRIYEDEATKRVESPTRESDTSFTAPSDVAEVNTAATSLHTQTIERQSGCSSPVELASTDDFSLQDIPDETCASKQVSTAISNHSTSSLQDQLNRRSIVSHQSLNHTHGNPLDRSRDSSRSTRYRERSISPLSEASRAYINGRALSSPEYVTSAVDYDMTHLDEVSSSVSPPESLSAGEMDGQAEAAVETPPLNANMAKRRPESPIEVVDDSIEDPSPPIIAIQDHGETEITEPTNGPTLPHKMTVEEKFERQISNVLSTVPVKINFSTNSAEESTNGTSDELLGKATEPGNLSPKGSDETSQRPTDSPEAILTLEPAYSKEPKMAKLNNNSSIKLYHLTPLGRDKPIKLFVRLVGDAGERVMVRVGGGWADLGEYLRDYVSHHGRVASAERPAQIQRVPSNPVVRPDRPVIKSRQGSYQLATGDAACHGSSPPSSPVAQIPRQGQSPTSATTTSSTRTRRRASSGFAGNDDTFGLAGPSTRKSEISADKQKWVDEMMSRARKAGGEKDASRRSLSSEYINMGKVGATRRVFSKPSGVE